MKKIFIFSILLVSASSIFAQKFNQSREFKVIRVNEEISSHIVVGEPIEYVDISTKNIVGDIPIKNILRIKPLERDSSAKFNDGDTLAMLTVVSERYKIQFNCVYTTDRNLATSNVDLKTDEMASYMNENVDMPQSQMRKLAWTIWNSGNKYFDVSREAYRIRITLNNIYTYRGFFFIDVSIKNKTKIEYDVDQIRFKVEDKRYSKATNFQQIEVEPILSINEGKKFTKEYRNIYVFEKFTFPDEKVFTVEVAEQQVSGRTVILRIDYTDILNADSFSRSLF